jgi:uncharacterized protein (TIGR03083 family)
VDLVNLIDRLELEGQRLVAAARRVGLDAPVPACPDWTVRDLVTHTGGIHRWAADIVTNRRQSLATEAAQAVGSGPNDAHLLRWFRAGHAALVEALRAAPADLECATFLPTDSPRHFWARRQAHETAIHRADAESAAGLVPDYPAEFAEDGIGEILYGFATRKRKQAGRTATLVLCLSDGPSWLLSLGGEQVGVEAGAGADPVDATLHGSPSEVYLWLWNRPSRAQLTGDRSVAELWARTVRVRWSR